MTPKRRAAVTRVVWVVIVWVVLWRDVSAGNVLGGLLVGIGLVWAFPPPPSRWLHRLHPLHAVRFIAHNALAIARANIVVAWEVITPRNRIHQAVVVCPLTSTDPDVVLMVSHSIGLAPGTVVLDVIEAGEGAPAVLHVHVLHFVSSAATRAEVAELERLALAALGSREATS